MKSFGSLKKSTKIYIFFMLVLVIMFFIFYNKTIQKPLKSNVKSIIVEVKQGEGLYDVLDRLDKENKLSNKLLLKVKLSIDKQDIKLVEGIYEIETNSSLDTILSLLQNTKDNKNLIKLTIPEGYSVEDISNEVEKQGLCTKEEFLEAVKAYEIPEFIKSDDKKRYNIEGFLYPDTYFVKKGMDANYIINIMINRFEQIIKQVKNETELKPENIEKTINIASMIEKEARFDSDRPLISSVIYNRIEKDMKLQLDATVLYALGYHVDKVFNKHLKVDSEYNTYKYNGLPLGPICNPGIKSIKAALLPTKTDYLYYILQKDGTHSFFNNYDDFLSKKQELGY